MTDVPCKALDAVLPAGCGVLFLVNSLSRGGSEHKTVQLANGLIGRGARPVVAYFRDGDAMRYLLDERITVIPLGRGGHFSPRVIREILRVVRERAIDVIIAVNPYPMLYGVLIRLLCRARKPGLVASVNTSIVLSARDRRRVPVYRWAMSRCDIVAFGAAAQQRLWEVEYQCSLPSGKAAVLYNGVDTVKFDRDAVDPIRPHGWPAGRQIIGIVAALRPEKAHVQLVEALARLRQRGIDAGLVIVGDGDCGSLIAERVIAAGLGNEVVMIGDVADVRPYLAAFDVFALPSIAVETFSNAALEAMAMGCPVVASAIGGMPEMLRYGGGTLFHPGDVDALATSLFDVLVSEERRLELGQAGRQAVVDHFSKEKMVDDFVRIIQASHSGG